LEQSETKHRQQLVRRVFQLARTEVMRNESENSGRGSKKGEKRHEKNSIQVEDRNLGF